MEPVGSDHAASPVPELRASIASQPADVVPAAAPTFAFARPQSGSPPRDAIPVRPQSGSPPREAIPVLPGARGAHVRNRTSSGSPPPFHGALWFGAAAGRNGREERPRFERDSLRNRSLEGRPGSRKNRRWTRSVEITGSLRRAMAKLGEDNSGELDLQAEVEWRPSAFYQLLEAEGPGGALEAWEAAEEGANSRPRQPRQKDPAQIAEENQRQVRRAFSDTWSFLQSSDSARDLLAKLEAKMLHAFGASEAAEVGASALLWMLYWDGNALETKFGSPPANEIAVGGLNPTFRKLAHQLARSLGLHSESRTVGGAHATDDNKVIALRPPRRSEKRACGDAWAAPFSVTQVLAQK